MLNSNSEILVIGNEWDLKWPTQFVKNFEAVKNWHSSTVVVDFDSVTNPDAIADWIKKSNAQTWVFVAQNMDIPTYAQILNTGRRVYLVKKSSPEQTHSNLEKKLELSFHKKQPASDLQTKAVSKNWKRTTTINKQIESLGEALMNVHKSQSAAEMEKLIFEALKGPFNLNWVRLFFQSEEQISTHLSRLPDTKVFLHVLKIGNVDLATIVFARKSSKSFSKTEEESMIHVAESVALNIDRLAKFDQASMLKQQWDATFNSISEPLCIANNQFQILRVNNAFIDVTAQKKPQLLGQNAFLAFCGQSHPLARESENNSFIIERRIHKSAKPRYYEVVTQSIILNTGEPPVLLIMFRDVTEQKEIEKKMLESAKMVELGTIGSSIAHDINNPLGGMISFLQLIRMDLKKTDPILEDILEMEKAGQKCKNIVENLLRFSRPQNEGPAELVDLNSLIERVIQLFDLQIKSLGVDVQYKAVPSKAYVRGFSNSLLQALSHIFQNAIDAVSEAIQTRRRKKGEIRVTLTLRDTGTEITVHDNGIGITPEIQRKISDPLFSTKVTSENKGLGLTLAYKIIYDHDGKLDFSSQPNIGTQVKISFPNV
jgi:two-component system NtrC family sensor kinase